MHDQVTNALRNGIVKAGALLEPLTTQTSEPHLIWRRDGSAWRSEWHQCPSLRNVFHVARTGLDAAGEEMCDAIRLNHPQFAGMVGFPSLGRINLLHSHSYILGQVMNTLWERHNTFQPSDESVEAIIHEFSQFIDQPLIQIRFTALLLNYRMNADDISLPDGLTLRRLTEAEVSEIHGGSLWKRTFTPQTTFVPIEFIIEGEYEDRTVFGDTEADATQAQVAVRSKLDKALLALRTFKAGCIGFESARLQSVQFCPIMLPSWAFWDLYVPFGSYAVSDEEIDTLREHAALIFTCNEPALEMACSRLADAQTRLKPRDEIIDAYRPRSVASRRAPPRGSSRRTQIPLLS